MKFQDFINKWNGKYLEVAGSSNAQNQCVDLANGYIRDVLGLPIIEWTNARDFPSKGGDDYDYILNTPEGIPQEGDLIIWNNTAVGHIAVFVEGNANSFRSFDQNYPTGSPCHIQNHSYSGVEGWMRAKTEGGENVNENDTKKSIQFDRITSFLNSISILPTDRSEDYINDDKLLEGVKNLNAENKKKAGEIDKLNEEISRYVSEKAELQKAVIACQTEKEILTRAANEDAIHDRDAEIKNLDLEKQVEELKKQQVAPIEPVIDHYEEIIEGFWPNLFKGKKTKSLVDRIWRWIS